MSADNWIQCPQCRERMTAERNRQIKIAEGLYGCVPVNEYTRAMQDAVALPEEPENDMFREDYEIGLSYDGKEFRAGYNGNCQTPGCNFEVRYSTTKPVSDLQGPEVTQ